MVFHELLPHGAVETLANRTMGVSIAVFYALALQVFVKLSLVLAAVVRQDGLNASWERCLHCVQETDRDAACRAAGHRGHAEAGGVVGRREHVVADAVAKARYRIQGDHLPGARCDGPWADAGVAGACATHTRCCG